MSNVTKEFIVGIPKAELHVHLEGTLEPELKLELAKKNGIDIGQKTIEEVRQSYEFDSLTSFLGVYYPAMEVLQKEEDFYLLAMDYLKKAKDNNVKYAELFFDPQAHTSRGVPFADVINGYYRAAKDGVALGVESHLIMCFLRDMSQESAIETYEQMLPYGDKIIGIGLDSDERKNPPKKFADVFARAKEDGFNITMHCDIDQENSIEHIRQALLEIGVQRIDHGTNILEDAKLVEYAKENGIGFTCCPVSNSFVTEDMKGKEILELLHKGLKVTVNSDDPAYFQSYISDDMYVLATKYNLEKKDIIQLAKNSFEIAWIPAEKKNEYIDQIDAYVENL
ncbi:adenosine deaminase [Anaerosphaera aminiphila DSM 21120]|uniref:Adenine deaminase n=1 Tax=Anaerosphaera aminiphila DSM 21120 TaxID=1120995 RepID=A0A1M5PKS0_9FIRM|nr:adenosine deaminase [Anaerosphaera aminiphila]SHH02300.1 adenosine deaminase [Anaerosphaera aminiphila DSM 21120]